MIVHFAFTFNQLFDPSSQFMYSLLLSCRVTRALKHLVKNHETMK